MDEVDGSIQWIDQPDAARFPGTPAAFFGEDRILRKMVTDDVENVLFGCMIDVRNRIGIALELGVEDRPESLANHGGPGPRRLESDPHFFLIHASRTVGSNEKAAGWEV